MNPPDLAFATAFDLAAMIRRREVSVTEVIESAVSRTLSVNEKLNCFCFVYADEAMDLAREADRAIAEGRPTGPLHGVPVAFKDLTPIRGKRTTMASPACENWVPDKDAAIVERLRDAGAIIVGKTTTPEFGHSIFTESALWGITRNPWNLDHTPGGSSGGSAAAVASGCVPLAEGSDMGGSIRAPAAFCGVVGFKPSFGRLPFDIFPSQFDQTCHFGPLARNVNDAALFFDVTHGSDDRDVQTLPQRLDVEIPLHADVSGRRIALSRDLGYCTVDAEVEGNLLRVADTLRDLGAVVEEVDLSLLGREAARWNHWSIYYAAMLADKLPDWRERMHPNLVAAIDKGLRLSAVEGKRLEFHRTREWEKLRKLFADHDALICPTTAIPAPLVGGADAEYDRTDEEGHYRGIEMCFHFNVVGQCPALSIPSGFTSAGLPTGVQIVGNRFDDLGVLRLGAALDRAMRWSDQRPPI